MLNHTTADMVQREAPAAALAADFTPLLSAGNWEALRLGAQRAYAALGVTGFLLRHQGMDGGSGMTVGSLPDALLRAMGRPEQDPIDEALVRSALPQTWRADTLHAACPGSLYGQLRAAGVAHGLSLACRSGAGVSRVDFYRGDDGNGFAGCPRQGPLLLLALHLHEGAVAVQRGACVLSERERECLAWSAQGKTSREVGMIMGISQRTVYFHLQNAATKLQVYSTRHAISRAVALGLLPQRGAA